MTPAGAAQGQAHPLGELRQHPRVLWRARVTAVAGGWEDEPEPLQLGSQVQGRCCRNQRRLGWKSERGNRGSWPSGTGSGPPGVTQRGSERLRERRIVWFPTRGAAGRLCQTCRVGVHPAQGTWRLTHTCGGGERRRTPGRVADQGRVGPSPCPRKAVVTGQEGHRPLQGAGALRGRGPRGRAGRSHLPGSPASRQQVAAPRCRGLAMGPQLGAACATRSGRRRWLRRTAWLASRSGVCPAQPAPRGSRGI